MHDTNRPTGHHAQVARKPQQYRGGSFIEIGTPSSVARVSGPLVGEESDSYPAVASLSPLADHRLHEFDPVDFAATARR